MSRIIRGRMTALRFRRRIAAGQRKVSGVLDALERAGEMKAALSEAATASVVQRPSRTAAREGDRCLRFVGVGLTIVNAVAAVSTLALQDRTETTPLASDVTIAFVLAGALAASQVLLALVLGKGLREIEDRARVSTRMRSSQLERFALIDGAALGVLSAFVGWVVYGWTLPRVSDAHGQLGVMMGLMLMLQAWVAPWLVVAETARTHPADRLQSDPMETIVRELNADLERDRSFATKGIAAARAALQQSERIVADVTKLLGRPALASWSYALDHLDKAIADAEARYAALDAGPGNDDDTPSGPGQPPVRCPVVHGPRPG
jgi:hypothetical protein